MTAEPRPDRVTAGVPCTWGELVQGSVDQEDVLVTCPVDLSARADATLGSESGGAGGPAHGVGGWQVHPRGREKVRRALAALVPGTPGQREDGTPTDTCRVRLHSPLRPGAGCATSTADLCTALAAVSTLLGRPLSPAALFARCLAVEPTDGIMFPGLALVDHRHGRRARTLGPPPPLVIAGLDPGGTVSSVRFNARPDLTAVNRRKEPAVRESLALIDHAIQARDPAALAAAATLSARAHQSILPNVLWEPAQQWGRETGALGINVAHSGVVLGLLYDPQHADVSAVQRWLARKSGLCVRMLQLVGGGVHITGG